MQKLAIGGIKLEGHPHPSGHILVVLHSSAGMQELRLSIAEWSRLASIEHVLDAAGRLVTDAQMQRDAALAELRELKAKQAAYAEATSHG